MNRSLLLLLLLAGPGLLVQPLLAEDSHSSSDREAFRFPGGDTHRGRAAFVGLNCVQCHTVFGIDLKEPSGERRLNLRLGGETRFVRSYEDLIVAITNPKHVVTEQYRSILTEAQQAGSIEPFMPDLTEDMSARQLMDLVAFLDSMYSANVEGYSTQEAE